MLIHHNLAFSVIEGINYVKLITALIFCLFKRECVGYDESTFPCEIMTTLKCVIQGGNHLHGQLCTLLKSVYTHAHILGGVITKRKINTGKHTCGRTVAR